MSDDYPSLFRECCLSVDVIPMADLNYKGSEQMSLVQLFVPTEVAHDTVAELGELGNVQFKDVGVLLLVSTLKAHLILQLNPNVNPFQRSFVGEIRRIDEMARRVRFFSGQIEKEKDVISIRPLYDSVPCITVGPRAAQTMDDLGTTLVEHETKLTRMNENYNSLTESLRQLTEARHVLRETAVFFDRVSVTSLPWAVLISGLGSRSIP